MPVQLRRGRSPASLVIGLAFIAFAAWIAARQSRSTAEAGRPSDEPCELLGPGACLDGPPPSPSLMSELPPPPRIDAATVCPTSGYLCTGLEQRGSLRVLRWNEATPEIAIRVPRPGGEATDAAIRLQQAAARGISVWNGHPIPIRVVLSDRASGEDFVVRWGGTLGGLELGRVETRWVQQQGSATLEVREFALTTRSPHQPSVTLDPAQVTLTAAHEMGHALGLPHSDSERDVMFPTNTARSLSTRDFRTMEALYSLQNGVEIVAGG